MPKAVLDQDKKDALDTWMEGVWDQLDEIARNAKVLAKKVEKNLTRQERLQRLEKQRQSILDEELQEIRRRRFTCKACKAVRAASEWKFLQDYWWDNNTGDTVNGGYHVASETAHCYIQCPECNANNRIYNHPQLKKIVDTADARGKFSTGRKQIFAAVEDVYPDMRYDFWGGHASTKQGFKWV